MCDSLPKIFKIYVGHVSMRKDQVSILHSSIKTEISISLRDYHYFYFFEDLVSFVKSITHDSTRNVDDLQTYRVRYQLYGRSKMLTI